MLESNEMQFHHIGIATNNLEAAIKVYVELGYALQFGRIFIDPVQKVKIGFMEKPNNPRIELLMPHGENSPVENVLKKNGATPYHTCYEVYDIEKSIRELQSIKFVKIIEPTPAVAFKNRRICFLYNKSIGLLELLEAQ